jgi:hypothetical protein
MRKSTALILLVVIAVTGLVVGFVEPRDAAARDLDPMPEIYCFVIVAPPCVYRCCTNGWDLYCQELGCAW